MGAKKLFTFIGLLLIYLYRSSEALDNGLALTPPMGWNSRQTFPNELTNETIIKTMADMMVSEGYKAAGYEYLIIDGWWWKRSGIPSQIIGDSKRFPNGMNSLISYVHNKGLKFGLYYGLGSTIAEANLHLLPDVNRFAEWGVDYVKFNTETEMENIYVKFGKALNDSGRLIVFSCFWTVHQEKNNLPVDYNLVSKTCNLWRNWQDIDNNYESLRKTMDFFAGAGERIESYAGPGHWNDPDLLIIGNADLTFEQCKMQMAIWAILAAPLFMSHDLRKIDPEIKSILLNKAVIEVNQDTLGMHGKRVLLLNGIEGWTRPITPIVNGSYSYAVVWTNTRLNGSITSIMINLIDLGLNHPNGYEVIDLFNQTNKLEPRMGSDVFTINLKPTETIFYKFKPILIMEEDIKPTSSSQTGSYHFTAIIVLLIVISLIAGAVYLWKNSESFPSMVNMGIRYRNHPTSLVDEDP